MKKFLSVLLAVCMLTAMAACGGEGNSSKAESSKTDSSKAEASQAETSKKTARPTRTRTRLLWELCMRSPRIVYRTARLW